MLYFVTVSLFLECPACVRVPVDTLAVHQHLHLLKSLLSCLPTIQPPASCPDSQACLVPLPSSLSLSLLDKCCIPVPSQLEDSCQEELG